MSIQDTIDELKRIGGIHGFHQPVEVECGVSVTMTVTIGSEETEHTANGQGSGTLEAIRFASGKCLLAPGGDIEINI